MPRDLVFRHVGEGEVHEIRAFYGHLPVYGGAHHVARLQLVGEALPVSVEQHRPFAAARFRDQKRPARPRRVQGGGVDLHVVHVLEGDAVARGDGARVAGKAGEVGGTRVRAADAAAGPKRLTCEDAQLLSVCRVRNDAAATRLRLMGLDIILRD